MCVWNLSMELFSFGIESMDTWFGTSTLCMGWVWKLPNSFLVRVELRKTLRLLYMCFGKCLVAF